MSQIFISYTRKDHFFVDRLREDLKRAGVDYWIDHEGLSPGTRNWERGIRNAIAEREAVIWVVSPASSDSKYVSSEIAVAEMHKLKIYRFLRMVITGLPVCRWARIIFSILICVMISIAVDWIICWKHSSVTDPI